MRRREFIQAIGAGVSWPLAARAQQKATPVIGALLSGRPSAPISVSAREAFQRGLREEGYVDGQNISIEYRYAEDTTELDRAANEIVGLRVDVIFTISTPGAFAFEARNKFDTDRRRDHG